MSLSRIPYLGWWESNSGASREDVDRASVTESDEEAYLDLPDDSIASSFSSSSSYVSIRRPTKTVAPGRDESIEDDAADVGPPGSGRERTDTESEDLPLGEPGLPNTTGAWEVDCHKRIAQVSIAVLSCFLSGGIIFGFTAIKPILIKEGVYQDLCSLHGINQGVSVCYGQEIRLNLMFTTAAITTNFSALPIGTILDAYGPRVCGLTGSCFLAIGSLFFVFGRYIPFDVYITGYVFLALAGPFIYISFHLSNTFPARSGMILAMLTGAYDASTAVFLAFNLINEYTDGFSTRHFFLIYLVIPLFILATQVTVMPATSYKTVGELALQAEAHTAGEANQTVHEASYHREIIIKIQSFLTFPNSTHKITSTIGRPTPILPQNRNNQPSHVQSQNQRDTILGTLHNLSARTQILSPYFILYTLSTALTTLRINYFLATVHHQYSFLLHSPALANHITQIFTILLPIGGIIAAPFTGTILDILPTTFITPILVIAGSVMCLMNCITSLPAAYITTSLITIYRPFFYASISDYTTRVFGFRNFGIMYGLVIFVSGMVGFAQVGLDVLKLKVFRGEEKNGVVMVNWLFTGVIGGVGVLWVDVIWWRVRRIIDRRDLESVEGEREPLLVNSVTENQYRSTDNP